MARPSVETLASLLLPPHSRLPDKAENISGKRGTRLTPSKPFRASLVTLLVGRIDDSAQAPE